MLSKTVLSFTWHRRECIRVEIGWQRCLAVIAPAVPNENLGAIILSVKEKIPDLAEEHNTELIPFFLDGVAGVPELNQSDRIHPNQEGQYILVENVWEVLEDILEKG